MFSFHQKLILQRNELYVHFRGKEGKTRVVEKKVKLLHKQKFQEQTVFLHKS